MSVYKTEEEQIDDLKRWIKSYGPSIVMGIVLAIALLYGWRYWHSYQHNRAVQASVLYQQAVDAYQTKRTDLLAKSVETLQNKYPKSPYASYGVFLQVKLAADQQAYSDAEVGLGWIIHHSHDNNIKAIAELRLGSIQTADHQEELAIKTLESIKNPAFKGLAHIKIADAYLALGDTKNAKINYEAAGKLLPDAGNTMPTLAVKLDNANAT
ncbi:MAG: tetratricopeptide repeat protein [Pseudomonadota bacterium]